MKCEKCIYFVEAKKETFEIYEPDKSIGTCRFNPPSFEGFPKVSSNDWCGQHKLDENKLNLNESNTTTMSSNKYVSMKYCDDPDINISKSSGPSVPIPPTPPKKKIKNF